MKKTSYRVMTIVSTVGLLFGALTGPAQASNVTVSWASSHNYTVSVSDTGTGAQRQIVYTLTATIGLPIITSAGTQSGNQLKVGNTQLMMCPASVVSATTIQLPNANGVLLSGCSWLFGGQRSDTANGSTSYTRTLRYSGSEINTYETLLQTLPQPVWAFGVYDSDTTTEVVYYSIGASSGTASTEASGAEAEQPVSFGGALISRAERSIVDGTGSMTLFGKRLFTITSATIGGIEVEMVRAARTDRSLVLSFKDLPVGVHDLVLHTTNGKMTFRGAVTIK